MEQDIKNIQNELLRLTQRLIGLENKLSSYDTYFSSVRSQAEASEKKIDHHGARISILEEARSRQIKLNSSLQAGIDAALTQKSKKFKFF